MQFQTIDDLVASIGAVTAQDVQQLAVDLAARPRSIVAVGALGQDGLDALDLG